MEAERRYAAQQEAHRLGEQLERELSPGVWRLVYEYGEAKKEAADRDNRNELYLMVECIAAHFPAFAPAILCMIQHAFDSDYGRGAECGHVAYPPTGKDRSGADE